ncbi:MAG: hypothetical protein PHQ72_04715 [Hespellia sp.]|nr:hypothetical protein [Hespellia sp.]
MNWINKLEKKFGKYAIPNLMWYIIILYGIGFVIQMVMPDFYYSYLDLDAGAILHGQIWRIVTFLIQPPSTSIWFVIFALYLYYMIGTQLERTWGAFRFNLYFFMGVLFHVIAAIIVYLATGLSLPMGTFYLNLSLFFAFAMVYPDIEFLLFFVIPVKVKYLAWLDAAFFGYTVLQAFLPAYGGSEVFGIVYKAQAAAAAVSILNFLVFYFSSRNFKAHSPKEVKRRRRYHEAVKMAKKSNGNAAAPAGAKHICAVCKRTELDDPRLEFRYCSKCNGNYEYCQDHLFTHTHVK